MPIPPNNPSKRAFKAQTARVQTSHRLAVRALGKRARGNGGSKNGPYLPPEDWHEPVGVDGREFSVVVQEPGDGFRHVVTEHEVRQRLDRLPTWMLEPLEVVQLSRMTRKKRRFPCYGMQWGSTLYLYPVESSLVEVYTRPPRPIQIAEARTFGGRWEQQSSATWHLIWTPQAINDFYLNNILIHELGHLLDSRNTSYVDRERFAEWFATQHGTKSRRKKGTASRRRKTVRRHHSC